MRRFVCALGSIWLCFGAAGPAYACSCEIPQPDLSSSLTQGRDQASSILLARVGARRPPVTRGSDGAFDAEVLEVFKGPLRPGLKFSVNSGDGINCGFIFQENSLTLIYSDDEAPTEVSMCSRSRTVSLGDVELTWLQTGRMPAIPVVIRREAVTCSPCEIDSVITKMLAVLPESGGPGRLHGEAAGVALQKGGPFWTSGRDRRDPIHRVAVGRAPDGGLFALRQVPDFEAEEVCRQRVERRWCTSLEPDLDAGFKVPPLRCVGAGSPESACDEVRSRTSKWEALEWFEGAQCTWRDPARPICVLPEHSRPVADAGSASSVTWCRPLYGTFATRFVCAVGVSGGGK